MGDSKETVVKKLGVPCYERNASLYYFNNELRFDCDQNGNIEFIEFLGGIDGVLQPVVYDVKAFEEDADGVVKVLARNNNSQVSDSENSYSFIFAEISVGVYRETIPANIAELIADAQEDGVILSAAEIAFEKRKAEHWSTIGIGVKGYYNGASPLGGFPSS